MSRAIVLPIVLAGFLWLATPASAASTDAAKSYVQSLKSTASGVGVLVGEPVPSKASASTSDFAAACSFWLQVVVGGEGKLGQTPLSEEVDRVRRSLHHNNFRLSAADVKPYSQMLGLTHVVTSTVSGDSSNCVITYVVRQSDGNPLGAPIRLNGTYAKILAGLPGLAKTLTIRLGGNVDQVPTSLAASPSDMASIGWALRNYDAPRPQSKLEQWNSIAPRSSLAGLIMAHAGASSSESIGQLIEQAHGNAYILCSLRSALATSLSPSTGDDGADAGVDAAIATQLVTFPSNYQLLREATEIALNQGNLALARQMAERGVKAAPKNAGAWIALARVLQAEAEVQIASQQSPDTAAWDAVSLQATQIAPGFADSWRGFERVAELRKDWASADTALARMIQLDPSNLEGYAVGLALYKAGRDPNPTGLRRVALAGLAQPKVAGQIYRQVVADLDAGDFSADQVPDIDIALFKVYRDEMEDQNEDPSGRIDQALKTLIARPHDAAAWRDFDQAMFKQSDSIRRGRPESRLNKREEWLTYELNNAAVHAARQKAQMEPKDSKSWSDLAELETFSGNTENAKAALWKSVELDPKNVDAYDWGLEMLQPKWLGDKPEEMLRLVQTLRKDPQLYETLSPRVVIALRQWPGDDMNVVGEIKDAEAAVNDLVIANPQTIQAQMALAGYFESNHKYDEARNAYEAWAKLDGANPETQYRLGAYFNRRNDPNSAANAYTAAIMLAPDYGNALCDLALILMDTKHQYTEARRLFSQDETIQPERAGVRYYLGMAFYGEKDVDGARNAWRAASDLDPDDLDHGNDARQMLEKTKAEVVVDAPSNPADWTPAALFDALDGGQTATVQFLLNHGVDPNSTNKYSQTPLIVACIKNNKAAAEVLLKKGAKLDIGTPPQNQMPMMYAVVSADPDVVETLIAHGADVNKRDTEDSAPLLWAAHAGRLDNVKVLLSHGANPNTHNIRNDTALTLAATVHSQDIIDALTKAGEKN